MHIGERDCSLQRRHQKVLEETPSPALNQDERNRIGEICAEAMRKLSYSGAGTIEFLYENGEFYFIEMNTRIQVEHPITEMISGLDLVVEQIKIAGGAPLAIAQADIELRGHAIECRINAETSRHLPALARQDPLLSPAWRRRRARRFGRLPGYTIPPYYDSLLGKLIVQGRTRIEALMRLRRALDEFIVDGVDTTLPLFRTLVRNADIQDGAYDIHWLENFLANGGMDEPESGVRRLASSSPWRWLLPGGVLAGGRPAGDDSGPDRRAARRWVARRPARPARSSNRTPAGNRACFRLRRSAKPYESSIHSARTPDRSKPV